MRERERDHACGCKCPRFVLVLLCFIAPPIAVGIHCGFCTRPWFVSLLLFIFGIIGSVIHGILVVCDCLPTTYTTSTAV